MKDIKQIIKEEINSMLEDTTSNNIFFHGSPKPISKFSDEFVGAKEANDQEGPGIYFSSSSDEAKGYGEHMHQVRLNPRKIVPKEGTASRKELKWLIKQAPDWKMNAQNWDENPGIGVEVALDSVLEYNDSPHEQFTQVWIEFFKYNPMTYVRAMVKLGYDLTFINKEDGVTHAVVLNPEIIEQI